MDDQAPDITAFLTDLAREARSERTWVAYQSDLNLFARWLTQTTGDPFTAKTLTRIDVRDYKQHLLSVKGRTPATVNRRLAALRAFGGWAKRKGLITELPTEGTSDVPVPKQAPKAVRDIAAKYGYQAQVDDAHPHAFRHSFATELLRKGAPLPTVGALLGHESLQSTARYTQPSERDLRAAVDKLALTEDR
jgi:site-specific recombinase XerD